jgi:hypothetical protein
MIEYTVDYFIEKFEAIPEGKWCTHDLLNSHGQRCAQGHCMPEVGNGEFLWSIIQAGKDTKERQALEKILPEVCDINNGRSKEYPQPTCKARILAALRDVKEKAK